MEDREQSADEPRDDDDERRGSPASEGDEVAVVVSVDDEHFESFEEVIAACESRGLHVQGRLDLLGVATGSVQGKLIAGLKAIPGVKAVEADAEVRIAPPESEIQ